MAALGTLTGTGNDYTITVTDSTLDGTALVALDAKTIGDITINAATTINGTLAEIKAIYAKGGAGIVNASENETVNISDTTIDTADLALVRANATGTSGTVNLLNVTTLTGQAGQIISAMGFGNVAGIPSNVAVTIKETGGTVDAQEISDLLDSTSLNAGGAAGGSAAKTTGLITIDQSAFTTGTITLDGNLNDVAFALKNSKLVADATADATGVEAVTVAGLSGVNVKVYG